MTGPVRIQRRRSAGWRMPEGAVYVGRPGRWGNPYHVGWCRRVACGLDLPAKHWHVYQNGEAMAVEPRTQLEAVEWAVFYYRSLVKSMTAFGNTVRAELRGRDLACWCPLEAPCHADVLLELANR